MKTILVVFGIGLLLLSQSAHAACRYPFDPDRLSRVKDDRFPIVDRSGKEVESIEVAQARMLSKVRKRLESVVNNKIPVLICLTETWNNARATQEDTVETTTTFLKRIGTNEDIVAMLIAHEFAHIIDQHIKYQTGYDRATARAAAISWTEANQGNGRVTLGTAVGQVVSAHNRYSRELELLADQRGLEFAIEARFNPWGSIKLYTDILKQDDEDDSESDHPATERRIAVLMKQYQEQLQVGKYIEQAKEQRSTNEKYEIVIAPMIAKKRWRDADTFVHRWIKEMPESGMAWYYSGIVMSNENPKDIASAEAFEKAVTYDPENEDAWFSLCMSLPDYDHRLESAYCSKHISTQEEIDEHKNKVFSGQLLVGGRDPYMRDVVLGIDKFGRKMITNDQDLVRTNGLSSRKFPPWWGLRPH